jgi:hypothetical protein
MKPKDELIIGPVIDDAGSRPFLRRSPEGEISGGILSDDTTNSKGAVELAPLGGSRFEVLKVTRYTSAGPAQVASPAYRDGWSRIFGGRAPVGEA